MCVCVCQTWDKDELADAANRLQNARALVHSQSQRNRSIGQNLLSVVGLSGDTLYSANDIELELINAESLLLQSQISVVTEESLVSLMKAGVQIRSAYKTFSRLYSYIIDSNNSIVVNQLDNSVLGGIYFGVGCFNLMFSALYVA